MSDKKGGHDDPKKDDAITSGSEKTAAAAKTALTGFFANVFNVNWDTLAQVGAPKLRREAEKLAMGAKRRFSVDHWTRSDGAEIAYNALVTNVKTAVGTLPDGITKTGLMELLEFAEAFIQKFCDEENGGGEKSSQKKAPMPLHPETQAALAKATADFIADAVKLIIETPPGKAEVMNHVLVERAECLWNLQDRLLNGPPKPPEKKKEPGVPFSERLHQVGEAVGGSLKSFNNEIEKEIIASKERTARKQAEQKAEREAEPMTLQRKLRRLLF